MKEHYRILLFPLKLPKLNVKSKSKEFSDGSLLNDPNNYTILNTNSSTNSNSSNQLPLPFLFVHLNKSITKSTNLSTGLNRRSFFSKFLNWGEEKWQEYSEAKPRSIKGMMHKVGSILLNRIPVTEKQLWKFHALHQFIQHNEKNGKSNNLEIETGSIYLSNPGTEQSIRFDLISQFNSWAAYHRRWSIFSSVLIFPVAILSILPFGKLFLAWVIFRAVAHWRAYQGAHFLVRCFNYNRQHQIKDVMPIKFISNFIIDQHLPLPPNFKSETIEFTETFSNLTRDLQLGELFNVLPRALKFILKLEKEKKENEKLNKEGNGIKRRKFSNQNLLEP